MGDALALASDVASCDLFQSESVRGAVYFYRGEFVGAINHFENALKAMPSDDPTKRNLADAYLAVGRSSEALATINLVTDRNNLWTYKIAKIYFYRNKLEEAKELIISVPTQLTEDGNLPGKPRILQAAIAIEISKSKTGADRDALVADAENQFKQGVATDSEKWKNILKYVHSTKHESFIKECESLKNYINLWID
ncbi:hypothetical protein GCM10007887_19430 [Methylobacterium haplocladii]|uniref:Uncharacterized protein n=2 Tax=Methylobacterium haplocladii TaxID=1176176 RepID=A0A512ISZ4_9HYPH|nr:hypothetical protein MHA02_32150 [Methylobacterium haplocladii]GLS59277.1 hypothetical protein GCM10007887_19430 [Methylobacterium haplocladii]